MPKHQKLIDDIQDRKDRECLEARKVLDAFLLFHSHYFEFSHRRDQVTGELMVESQPALDRRSSELFQKCRDTNEAALDFEYANRNSK
jgi:hypothetical protein